MMKRLMLSLSLIFLHTPLFSAVNSINSMQDFQNTVLNSPLPVVVKFSGKSCPPCMRFAPVFELVSREFAGKVLFVAIDVDAMRQLSEQYGVRSIPTLLYFNHGKKKEKESGYQSADKFKSTIRRVFGL